MKRSNIAYQKNENSFKKINNVYFNNTFDTYFGNIFKI